MLVISIFGFFDFRCVLTPRFNCENCNLLLLIVTHLVVLVPCVPQTCFISKQLHYHLEVQANPKKLFLASMVEMGLSQDINFKFSLRPFEVIEVEWQLMLNFEAATSKFCNYSWKFGSSPQKGKVDLCMTNGSKVLIYLTFLYFIFYCTLVYSCK